jgi:hypothetical protein
VDALSSQQHELSSIEGKTREQQAINVSTRYENPTEIDSFQRFISQGILEKSRNYKGASPNGIGITLMVLSYQNYVNINTTSRYLKHNEKEP